jgi:hypothetical protein
VRFRVVIITLSRSLDKRNQFRKAGMTSNDLKKDIAKRDLKSVLKEYKKIDVITSAELNHNDVGSKLILPFIKSLGWNTGDIYEVKEQQKTSGGPVDYSPSCVSTGRLYEVSGCCYNTCFIVFSIAHHSNL